MGIYLGDPSARSVEFHVNSTWRGNEKNILIILPINKSNKMSNTMNTNKVPVTLVSGWLGAGKTTLVENLLRNSEGKKIGILVNDMAGINIDANILSRVVVHKDDMVELSNGCICCTLRKDFVEQLAQLAGEKLNDGSNVESSSSSRRFDYIVVESSGISEPQQVAEAFDLPLDKISVDEGNYPSFDSLEEQNEYENNQLLHQSIRLLQNHAYLDTTVSVVDAFHFLKNVRTSTDSLLDLGQANDTKDTRVLSELLIEQVEFADVLIINKMDLVSSHQLDQLKAFLSVINPEARQYVCQNSKIDPHFILGTSLFSMEKARNSAGWLQSLQGNHIPESIEYGITNFVFRANRPFHPARFHRLLFGDETTTTDGDNNDTSTSSTASNPVSIDVNSRTNTSDLSGSITDIAEKTLLKTENETGNDNNNEKEGFLKNHPLYGLIRSKGVAWIATERGYLFTLQVAQVGLMWNFSYGDPWYDALSIEEWNTLDEEDKGFIRAMFSNEIGVGDRKQEIVFIGVRMDTKKVQDALEDVLLTKEEWKTYTQALNIAQSPGDNNDPSSTVMITASASKTVTKEGNRSSPARVRKPTKTMQKKALRVVNSSEWMGDWEDNDDDDDDDDELIEGDNDNDEDTMK